MLPKSDSDQSTDALTAAYAERNAVVLAFAHLADARGWTVGQLVDEHEPDWPVLMIDTPAGQVSWHFKADEMPPKMPAYPGEWDGHTTPEKYERLATLIRYAVASDEEQHGSR